MMNADVYAVLAERHGYPTSARYRRILEFLMTPQQARITADLPLSAEEMATKQDLPLDTVKAEIDALFRKGVVFPKNFNTLESPRFARTVMQLHDATQSILDIKLYDEEAKKQLYYLWEDFCEEEYYTNQVQLIETLEQPAARVVPAYRAIKDIEGIQPYEDMREILKAQELIAVCSCSCRKRRATVGKPCEHSHDVTCLQLNRGAAYAIARGTGRKLTYDQVLTLIDEIEEDGLVHSWGNDRGMSQAVFCSCCIDCCMIWHPFDSHNRDIGKFWAKSRFQIQINEELCNGCKICVKRCMFGAIDIISMDGSAKKLKAVVNPDKCFGCGACVLKCKPGALSLTMVRPVEHIPEVGATLHV
jgi:ferredoxin